MRRALAVLVLLCLGAAPPRPGLAQGSQLPRPSDVVKARAYVSLEPVPRGRAFELAVVAETRPGFHINAHKVTGEYLIPTALEAQLPAGFRALETLYPPGVLRKFEFSPEKLRVYEGRFTLRMKLEAAPDAPLGPRQIPLWVRYQACNQEACLPPAKIPVTAALQIAPAGTLAHAAHPDIFPAMPKSKAAPPR